MSLTPLCQWSTEVTARALHWSTQQGLGQERRNLWWDKRTKEDKTKNKKITNSGLETNFFRNSFFLNSSHRCQALSLYPGGSWWHHIPPKSGTASQAKWQGSSRLCCTVPKDIQEKMAGSPQALSSSPGSNGIRPSSTWLLTDEEGTPCKGVIKKNLTQKSNQQQSQEERNQSNTSPAPCTLVKCFLHAKVQEASPIPMC